MLPDPLGGASLFRHEYDGLTVWSTDYRELVRTLIELGARPEPSGDYQIERLVLGNGGLTEASFEGGRRLPIFHGVIVDSDGVHIVEYQSAAVLREDRPYIESVTALRNDILESVSALASADVPVKISHMTGGKDSRLVLGALLETGHANEFLFFCSGPTGSPDRDIADALSRQFGLRRASSGGLTPKTIGDTFTQRAALLKYSAGLMTAGPTGHEDELPVMIAAGGYGELMRSFYRKLPTRDKAEWRDEAKVLSNVAGKGLEDLLANEAIDTLAHNLVTKLRDLTDQRVPLDFVGNALYLSVRNRYLVGAKAVMWNRVGVETNPLYSVHAVAAARQLGPEARDANVLIFDVLQTFGHHLAELPFDKNPRGAKYAEQRRVPEDLTFTVHHPNIEWVDVPRQVSESTTSTASSQLSRDEILARANAMGVPYWQSQFLESAQQDLRELLASESGDALDGMFRREYLREISRTTTWNRRRIRHVFAAGSIARWWSDPV